MGEVEEGGTHFVTGYCDSKKVDMVMLTGWWTVSGMESGRMRTNIILVV